MQIAVRISAETLQRQMGTGIAEHPGYREALIESSVFVNASVTAFDLRREVENLRVDGMKIVYGVYEFETLLVRSAPTPENSTAGAIEPFHDAPRDSDEFHRIAAEITQLVTQRYGLDA